jgi:ribosomal protein L31
MQQSSLKTFLTFIAIFLVQLSFGQTTTKVNPFSKVIISPNIQVTFIEGNVESVTIEKSTVSNDKIHIEVNDKTLCIYLDGQKDLPKNETTQKNGYKHKESVYKGTVLTATVTYKTLNDLSIRGEETQICKSTLKGKEFKLKIYGESKVTLDNVSLDEFQATIYGESTLEIKSGTIKDQRYTAYGESVVKSFGIDNDMTKTTAYGGASFKINASKNIKITAYGDARLEYKGGAEITKGLIIGDVKIEKVD